MARMQELLSSYYGIQDEQTEAQSMRNIDSPGFDASTYVKVGIGSFSRPRTSRRRADSSCVRPHRTCYRPRG